MTDARAAALEALRRWSATSRADLVAAAWLAGNRNIAELARVAGRGRDAIYADLESHGIDPSTDRLEPPTVPTDESQFTALPIPGWRHPHLISIERRKSYFGREYRATTKPFTGAEPRPEIPEQWVSKRDDEPDWDMCIQRDEEIGVIQKEWAKAHFTYRVGELLRRPPGYYGSTTAADVWGVYVAARDTLAGAYAALDTTPDTMWRAALLRIIDAKEPARLAASNWDSIAHEFAKLDQWLLREIGEENHTGNAAVRDAAKTHGVDTSDWTLGYVGDYESSYGHSETAGADIDKIIERGDVRIAAVKQYVGKN